MKNRGGGGEYSSLPENSNVACICLFIGLAMTFPPSKQTVFFSPTVRYGPRSSGVKVDAELARIFGLEKEEQGGAGRRPVNA